MSGADQPKGELVIQTIAMPMDTNANGDIFGGWLTSQMDLGSGILAAKTAQARVVTVAMEGMSFLQPVRVGDTVRCYARVEKIGRTSMTIPMEVWVTRYMTGEELRVTHGVFTLVAVDESRETNSSKTQECVAAVALISIFRLMTQFAYLFERFPVIWADVLLSGGCRACSTRDRSAHFFHP